MKDFVEKLELETYWESPALGIHPDLAKMLDEAIKKGSYTKWVPMYQLNQYVVRQALA